MNIGIIVLALSLPSAASAASPESYDDYVAWVMTSTMTHPAFRRFYEPEMARIQERKRKKAEARARYMAYLNGTSYSVARMRRMNVPPGARKKIDKARGGLLKRLDSVAVAVPPTALSESLELSISHPPEEAVRETVAQDKKLSMASLPVAFGPEGTTFSVPVTITLPYDASLVKIQGLNEANLKIHYWNPRASAWEVLISRVDPIAKTVNADVQHFSVYQVLGPGGIGLLALEADLGFKALYAFPSPIRGPGTVTFRVQPGLADSVTVRVYDSSGRKVHESSSFIDRGAFDDGNGLGAQFTYEHGWDVSGVGSGAYTFVVTAKKAGQADVSKTGKVAVIK